MRTVAEYLSACLEAAGPLPKLEVVLPDTVGCVLATDIASQVDVPRADISAVDGYAARREDLLGHSEPPTLPVAEDIRSGADGVVHLVPGTLIRLAAGAEIPIGATCVIPTEDTDDGRAQATILRLPPPHGNIRKQAEDLQAGEQVLAAGQRVGARQVALLAAAGQGRVAVHPHPRVVIITVGSELVEPGRVAHPGQVYDANSHALATAVRDAGGMTIRVPAVSDETGELRSTIENQMARADLIITTGGLGSGTNDTVKEALSPLGTVRFDNVAMAPGRQLGVGTISGSGPAAGPQIPIFCLPGNPLAGLIAFEVFVRPVLRKMAGYSQLHRTSVDAEVLGGWHSPEGRREFACVRLTGDGTSYQAKPIGTPGKMLLSAYSGANALTVIPEDVTTVHPGDVFPALLLDQ